MLISVIGYRKHDSSHLLVSSCCPLIDTVSLTILYPVNVIKRYFFTISHRHLCSLYSPSCLKNVKQTFFLYPPPPPINHYSYAIHSCIHEALIIKPWISFISVVSLPVNYLSICYSRESLLNCPIAYKTL